MSFPVYLTIGSLKLHPHFVFEFFTYIIAFRLLLFHRLKRDTIPDIQRGWVLVGGMLGALIGAKILVILQHLDLYQSNRQQFFLLFVQGKTIVGGLLGGLIGVELIKKVIKIKRSTGDVFVYPLIVGIAIGRIGCFLTGLSDRTYGTPTQLAWGVDFGDGILRHPTQIYEIVFLIFLIILFSRTHHLFSREGDLFKAFMIAYLGFRLLIDFLKPDFHLWAELSAIQLACIGGLIYYTIVILKRGYQK